MELRDYIRILRAHWLGVLVIIAVTVAATAVYTFTQPKVYAADATGFVSTGGTEDPALASINDQLAKSRAVSYVDVATSRATALAVKEDLGLDSDPAALANDIEVEQPPDTVLLKITARGGSPLEAKQLADAWVTALASQVKEIENADSTNSGSVSVLRVIPIESAALPGGPVSPQPVRNLALGLFLGLLLGVGYAMVRNILDRRLRTPEAVEERFKVNVVGAVPVASVLGHGPQERAQLALQQSGSADQSGAGEAFRKLRTNLTYMDVDNPPRVIVVTSPRPGDGKSTVAINLAAAIAYSGQPVVLVDADLRRPSVASGMGLVGAVGLTDVLVGRISWKEALQETSVHEGFRVLAAGRIPPNPSELLGSNSMRAMIEEVAVDHMVVLDAPPLLPVTDAAILTTKADGALVVISTGVTVDAELGTALGHIESVNGRTLGVIMNKVPRRGANSGYYAGYYSGEYASQEPSIAEAKSAPTRQKGRRAKVSRWRFWTERKPRA